MQKPQNRDNQQPNGLCPLQNADPNIQKKVDGQHTHVQATSHVQHIPARGLQNFPMGSQEFNFMPFNTISIIPLKFFHYYVNVSMYLWVIHFGKWRKTSG
jgi:hypothetical protein